MQLSENQAFFFQAEDGIRDVAVTGVQTCALPIYYKDSKVVKIFTSYSYDEDKLSIGNITAYPRAVVKKILYEK